MYRTFSRKGRKGFTLVELLVVVLILAILMAVAIPAYLAAVRESRRRTCRANMQTIAHAEQAFLIKHPAGYEPNLQNLVGSNPDGTPRDLQAMPICPENGQYSVDTGTNNQGPITIHCTIPDHDKTDDGNNTGYQPGRDAS
ncbi:MAG TPA: prepilin-type N-terminal cleavage/methylation domain-containing protein [Chthonomonadaceae bacterium]|nr:prepilin-type N-terminal cleavage/methylation domain-containing protein [Chthonomonadaceae bacterium]